MLKPKLENKAATVTRVRELEAERDQVTRKLRGVAEQVERLRRSLEEALVEGKEKKIADYRDRLQKAETDRATLEGELEALTSALKRVSIMEAEAELKAAMKERAELEDVCRAHGEDLEAALVALVEAWEAWERDFAASKENHGRIRALHERLGIENTPGAAHCAVGLPAVVLSAVKGAARARDKLAMIRRREANPPPQPQRPPISLWATFTHQ